MRRKLRIALIAALVATVANQAIADTPPGSGPYPSSQRGSTGSGMPGSSGGDGSTNPDGSPNTNQTDGTGSGTSSDGSGGTGTGTGTGTGDGNGTGTGADSAGSAANSGAANSSASTGLGGSAGGSSAPPGMIGDFEPISKARVVTTGVSAQASTRFPHVPTPIPAPVINGRNPGIVNGNGTTSVLFKLTGLKISDNQSPQPQDRVFYSFNYFDNLNASVDRHQLSPIQNLQVYHQLFGIEKTFLDGKASVGFRVPLNTISLHSAANIPGLGGSSTSPGDLSIFFKYAVYQQGGNLISTGFQISPPTGPGAFGGNKYYSYFRDTQIQPFVGYIFNRDRFYVQGFTSINVPTTSQDVTLLFNDIGIGYYLYRPTDPSAFLTAIVPTAEVHLNTPLNHRGFSATDLASTPDILDMTFGTNIEIRRRAILTAAYVTPVTGPKPFNAELVLLLNIRFGGRTRGQSPLFPPITR